MFSSRAEHGKQEDTRQTSQQFVAVFTLNLDTSCVSVSVRCQSPTWLQCWKYCAVVCLWALCHRLAKGTKPCLMLQWGHTILPFRSKEWVFIWWSEHLKHFIIISKTIKRGRKHKAGKRVSEKQCSWYDVIFIKCYQVSTWWQWSVNLYTNRRQTTIHMTRKETQYNTKTHNTENRNQNIQNKETDIKRITKNTKRVITT
jgi:hypothetical protein